MTQIIQKFQTLTLAFGRAVSKEGRTMRLETILQLICVGLIVFASIMIATDNSNSSRSTTVTHSVDPE